jgi:hypothetical protein
VGHHRFDTHTKAAGGANRTIGCRAPESAPASCDEYTSAGHLARNCIENGSEILARRSWYRDHAGQPLRVVCAATMVPQHPGSLPSPPGRLDHEVAAVGSDDQVGTRKHVESMVYACPRATVVENHDLGYESPPADPHSPVMGHVLDSLLEPGCCQPALVAVPAGERHRRRQD